MRPITVPSNPIRTTCVASHCTSRRALQGTTTDRMPTALHHCDERAHDCVHADEGFPGDAGDPQTGNSGDADRLEHDKSRQERERASVRIRARCRERSADGSGCQVDCSPLLLPELPRDPSTRSATFVAVRVARDRYRPCWSFPFDQAPRSPFRATLQSFRASPPSNPLEPSPAALNSFKASAGGGVVELHKGFGRVSCWFQRILPWYERPRSLNGTGHSPYASPRRAPPAHAP